MSPVVSSGRTNYCVPQDLVAFGVPAAKATTEACEVASRIVDTYTGRTFEGAAVATKIIYDVRSEVIPLPTPFTNVTAVTIDGVAIASSQYDVEEGVGIRLYKATLKDADGFPRRVNPRRMRVPYGAQLEVSATFGYTTVPGPVALAAKMLAARFATSTVNDLVLPVGMDRIVIEGNSQFAGNVPSIASTGDQFVDRLLNPYRTMAGAVG